MKYAIVFPGQGSQSLGMLAELNSNFSIVQEVFTEASDILGLDLWQITQQDSQLLNQTQNTQPAMLAAGCATYQILQSEAGIEPICFAGHSLGEYSALVAANSLQFADAVKLVARRAELMQNAVPQGTGAMAAILGLNDELVIDICAQYQGEGVVEAVNFNANGQVVIAGDKYAVEKTCELMKAQGAKRAVVLPVSVPSHCSLMLKPSQIFAQELESVNFISNKKVLHNVDALYADDAQTIKRKLVSQLHSAVLWTKTVHNMADMGVEKLIEAGPGKVLSALTKRIDKSLEAQCVFDMASLEAIVKETKE
jgi:[acyl-carrier-protein] S-malonyltransferase